MEQMIAELKNGLKADRMSCNKFSANQFGLYLHCAAYLKKRAILCLLDIFRLCFQAHRTAFIRKTMQRQGNEDQSDSYCEDKAWWL